MTAKELIGACVYDRVRRKRFFATAHMKNPPICCPANVGTLLRAVSVTNFICTACAMNIRRTLMFAHAQ